MKSVIGIILIILGVYLGYNGVQILRSSDKSIEIGNLEIGAKDKKKESNGYIWLGGGLIALIAGAVMVSNRNK